MPINARLTQAPASHLRICIRFAYWFLGSLALASLGVVFSKVTTEPLSRTPEVRIQVESQALPSANR